MKKLINQPANVVGDMLEGLLLSHGGFAKLSGWHVLLRSDIESVRNTQVALVSGGGSGHEPAHAGYVGAGMLSAAVAGEVFTSPSTNSVVAAIKSVAGRPGVLLIVKNYTGDRLNFGLAGELVRDCGIAVETVVVADDIALVDSEENAGRRGLAGTVFVHKVAGAAALEGKSLGEVALIARETAQDVATMGASLSAGTIPSVGKPSFTLGESEMELGLGIHGEPGVRRMPIESAEHLAERMVEAIVSAHRLERGERIAVLVNNLGASTNMELSIFAGGAIQALEKRELVVERVYCGTFLSSLDTAGVSLSVLRVDDERLKRLDAPTSAPAWPNVAASAPGERAARIILSEAVPRKVFEPPKSESGRGMQGAIGAVCVALKQAEAQLTELDRVSGDGDLGMSLTRGANAIEAGLSMYPLDRPAETLRLLATTVQDSMGGSSGALYAVLLLRAAQSLEGSDGEGGAQSWARALREGCAGVSALGGAHAGDRTMLDALLPFTECLTRELESGLTTARALEAAAKRAEEAAAETANMLARRGRSSYLGGRALGSPDPGAVAAAVWLRALSSWAAS